MKDEKCPHCGKHYHPAGGRYLSLTDAQIIGILEHSTANQPKHTIKMYCELTNISTYSYRLVAQMRLKQTSDIERVQKLDVYLKGGN